MSRLKRSPIQHNKLPKDLKPWLCAEGSLTRQLTQLAQGQFRVEPIVEAYRRLEQIDARWMNMPNHHIAWVRESYLFGCESQAWVRAKSIFPILSLRKKARIFPHIQKQPIGRFLFQRTTPQCQRRIIRLAEGWTRQSCYTWHGCQFIVQETFLPAFEDYLRFN
ncbi:chorismate--pyruvate lyase family protein [Acinetobacter sp. MD2(2019)]|uniref:chorismate--pyruvate lyase family protein n=1 Tax=Acinetobacter sp. MD2(2019) TaxID=2605273 RepID=UPI002D1E5A2A|nr:chorismate lyase [Acinetobacter sp. MD2(2019)]MEB3754023.1 chorismate lyase [Acinetobacter sp. MD2(2019)]